MSLFKSRFVIFNLIAVCCATQGHGAGSGSSGSGSRSSGSGSGSSSSSGGSSSSNSGRSGGSTSYGGSSSSGSSYGGSPPSSSGSANSPRRDRDSYGYPSPAPVYTAPSAPAPSASAPARPVEPTKRDTYGYSSPAPVYTAPSAPAPSASVPARPVEPTKRDTYGYSSPATVTPPAARPSEPAARSTYGYTAPAQIPTTPSAGSMPTGYARQTVVAPNGNRLSETIKPRDGRYSREEKYDPNTDRKVSSMTRDAHGAPVAGYVAHPDGKEVHTNYRSGTITEHDPYKGTYKSTYADGSVRERSNGGKTVRYTPPGGGPSTDYSMRSRNYGHSTVNYYSPQRTSTFDDPWFWIFMMNNSNHASASSMGYSSGSAGGYSGGYSGGGGSSSAPATPSQFNYDWANAFSNLPADLPTQKIYRAGAGSDWVTDYVGYEYENEFNAPRPWWFVRLWHRWSGIKDPRPPRFELDAATHSALSAEVLEILQIVNDHKDVPTIKDRLGEDGKAQPITLIATEDEVEVRDLANEDVCKLQKGNVLRLKEGIEGIEAAKFEIMRSDGIGEHCKLGATVQMGISQAQEMLNDLGQRVERGLRKLAEAHANGKI